MSGLGVKKWIFLKTSSYKFFFTVWGSDRCKLKSVEDSQYIEHAAKISGGPPGPAEIAFEYNRSFKIALVQMF